MNLNNFKYKLFGRFRGRKKLKLISKNDLKKYSVDLKSDLNINNYNILDIGSGSGENAVYLHTKNPNAKIYTCELYEDGNINLCNKIITNNLKNIFLFQGNVLEFLDKLETFLIFDEIWILFPDPWPKKRHHKRRLINNSFLKKISLHHKINGKLFLSSDSHSYLHSIINSIKESESIYIWNNQKVDLWNYTSVDLPITKFYKKAKKLNRNSMFFELHKYNA